MNDGNEAPSKYVTETVPRTCNVLSWWPAHRTMSLHGSNASCHGQSWKDILILHVFYIILRKIVKFRRNLEYKTYLHEWGFIGGWQPLLIQWWPPIFINNIIRWHQRHGKVVSHKNGYFGRTINNVSYTEWHTTGDGQIPHSYYF